MRARGMSWPVMLLGCLAAVPLADAQEFYAPNFGVHYQLVPYYGTYGARLTRHPVAGSAAAALGLEPGDVLVEADGLRFRGPGDVANHWYWTPLKFINVRTGGLQEALVYMQPVAAPPPVVMPPAWPDGVVGGAGVGPPPWPGEIVGGAGYGPPPWPGGVVGGAGVGPPP